VEKGWVYGYLGPNGAGKTTTIRTMLGLLKPNQGEVQITGINPTKDPVQALQSLGYAPELPTLQPFFTGEQLLDFMGKMFGLGMQARKEKIKQLLDLVGLEEWGDKKIGKYSKGMVQRLSIALALINDPWVLIMDEPTIGMDPERSNNTGARGLHPTMDYRSRAERSNKKNDLIPQETRLRGRRESGGKQTKDRTEGEEGP